MVEFWENVFYRRRAPPNPKSPKDPKKPKVSIATASKRRLKNATEALLPKEVKVRSTSQLVFPGKPGLRFFPPLALPQPNIAKLQGIALTTALVRGCNLYKTTDVQHLDFQSGRMPLLLLVNLCNYTTRSRYDIDPSTLLHFYGIQHHHRLTSFSIKNSILHIQTHSAATTNFLTLAMQH